MNRRMQKRSARTKGLKIGFNHKSRYQFNQEIRSFYLSHPVNCWSNICLHKNHFLDYWSFIFLFFTIFMVMPFFDCVPAPLQSFVTLFFIAGTLFFCFVLFFFFLFLRKETFRFCLIFKKY